MENEYRLKCGDALGLENKGRYGSFQLDKFTWEWQVKLCDPSLTRVIPERLLGGETEIHLARYVADQ